MQVVYWHIVMGWGLDLFAYWLSDSKDLSESSNHDLGESITVVLKHYSNSLETLSH